MSFLEKWRKKSFWSKLSDIFFILLLVAMLIPGPRKNIMAGINWLKAKVIPPSTKNNLPHLTNADYSWSLIDTCGKVHYLSEFKGKVIFINFWATWCGPCIGEMPEIQRFYEEYRNDDRIVFLIVTNDDLSKSIKFLRSKDYHFPVYFTQSYVPRVLSTNSIPTSFLIDKKGNLVMKHIGVSHWSGKKMKKIVNSLLDE